MESRGGCGASPMAFDSSISAEMAVLNSKRSKRRVTASIVWCVLRTSAGDGAASVAAMAMFQTRVRKRYAPFTASSDQATDNTRAANNLVLNCDSYENLDQATNGENADGFAAKLRIGPGNVFRGCRAWNNADDGWDFFASDDVVVVDGCWAFLNGKVVSGSNTAGDGNGFKLGGAPSGPGEGGAVHLVMNSYAFDNRACGFVRNNNPDVPKLTSCGARGNATSFCSLSSTPEVSITMTGAQGKAAVRAADGSLPAIQ